MWSRLKRVASTGDTLQAYGALQRVIAAGASPGSVALVTPPAAEGAANCFSSTDVENLVGGHLEGLGVTLYQGYTLTGSVFRMLRPMYVENHGHDPWSLDWFAGSRATLRDA